MPRDNANSHIVHGIDRKYVSVSSYHGHESSVHVHLHGLQSSSGSEILLEQGADFGREARSLSRIPATLTHFLRGSPRNNGGYRDARCTSQPVRWDDCSDQLEGNTQIFWDNTVRLTSYPKEDSSSATSRTSRSAPPIPRSGWMRATLALISSPIPSPGFDAENVSREICEGMK